VSGRVKKRRDKLAQMAIEGKISVAEAQRRPREHPLVYQGLPGRLAGKRVAAILGLMQQLLLDTRPVLRRRGGRRGLRGMARLQQHRVAPRIPPPHLSRPGRRGDRRPGHRRTRRRPQVILSQRLRRPERIRGLPHRFRHQVFPRLLALSQICPRRLPGILPAGPRPLTGFGTAAGRPVGLPPVWVRIPPPPRSSTAAATPVVRACLISRIGWVQLPGGRPRRDSSAGRALPP
jgi:hypothetical protein